MRFVRLAILPVCLVWAGTAARAASASKSVQSLQDRRQAACYGDVQRLCATALPDVDKVTDCMRDKRPLVSAKCSAMWDVTE